MKLGISVHSCLYAADFSFAALLLQSSSWPANWQHQFAPQMLPLCSGKPLSKKSLLV